MKYVCIDPTLGAAVWTTLGSLPMIDEISSLSNTRHYRYGSDPTQVTQFTFACLTRALIDSSITSPRYCAGSFDGVGGFGLRWTGFGGFGDERPLLLSAVFADNGGTVRVIDSFEAFNAGKLVLFVFVYNGNILGGTTAWAYANGVEFGSLTVGGVTGAPTAGGSLTVGATNEGATDDGLGFGFLHGAAWVDRAISVNEMSEFSESTLQAFELQDIPGGWSDGWRVEGADPGASWAPFVGATSLTRFGTAATYAPRLNPMVY